jgi:hypothetical protein
MGPLAPPTRDGAAELPLALPPGRPLTPGRLARKAKAGPQQPWEVTEPQARSVPIAAP